MKEVKTSIQNLLEQDGVMGVSVRIYDSVLIVEVLKSSASQIERFMKVGIETGILKDNAAIEVSRSGKLAMSAVLLNA